MNKKKLLRWFLIGGLVGIALTLWLYFESQNPGPEVYAGPRLISLFLLPISLVLVLTINFFGLGADIPVELLFVPGGLVMFLFYGFIFVGIGYVVEFIKKKMNAKSTD